MSKRIHWVIAIVLLLACTFCAYQWRACETTHKNSDDRINALRVELDEANAFLDSLDVVIIPGLGREMKGEFWYHQARWARENQGMLLQEHEIGALQDRGLDDPVEQLRSDLNAHPELIPYEGVLGGTPHFIRYSICLLSTKWVYAEFSDGHFQGQCLLEYDVASGGYISWSVIRADIH